MSSRSLELFHHGRSLFVSHGKWLHPLFELEQVLSRLDVPREELHLFDKVTGRAGSLLIVRLGIRSVKTELLSELGREVFEMYGVRFESSVMTPRILCQTEELLENVTHPEEAHRLVRERIEKKNRTEGERSAAEHGNTEQLPERTKPPLVHLRNVNVVLSGRHVLSALDLDVAPSDRLVIVGANGSGKTTLLKTIMGIVARQSGTLQVGGSDPAEGGTRQHNIGYVPQDVVRSDFPVSAEEVVEIGLAGESRHGGGRLGRRALRARIHAAMEEAGCRHLAGRSYQQLSGGERQRLALARCLCQEPSLLLLDEPTAHLDPESRAGLVETLEQLGKERKLSVVAVSHDLTLWSPDRWRIAELSDGRFAHGAMVWA